ncbi:MAG: type II toxin-antitoxin system PemK/MazF family toxin [Gemmatimonadetes bacterium]|nr:type II toxin-antitoxin system PemK/MazF family toxin [Gemmatimonadota bacterium]
MIRGEIYRLVSPPGGDPRRSRCYVVVSRQTLLDSKADKVICAPVNTAFVGLETQVAVGEEEGLKHASCVNCDQLVLIEKSRLTNYVGSLPAGKLPALRRALRVALEVD